jgi:hypothetical protein
MALLTIAAQVVVVVKLYKVQTLPVTVAVQAVLAAHHLLQVCLLHTLAAVRVVVLLVVLVLRVAWVEVAHLQVVVLVVLVQLVQMV